MAEVAKAYVSLIPSAKGFAAGIQREIGGDVGRAGSEGGRRYASGFSSSALPSLRRMAAAAAGFLVLRGAKDVIGFGLSVAANNEQAQISFETMLGSAKKARTFLGQLQKFAAATPFDFPGLQKSASSLISAGINAKDVIPIMRTLGDVTSGMGTGADGIQRATVALQQMNAAQKISGEDLNQLRDAGIPVYDLLSKALGKSKGEVVKLAQSGKLGKDALDKMMGALKSGKGLERFSGLMDKQSQSLTGLVSTFKDTFGQGLAKAIQPLIPLIKDGLGGASAFLSAILPKVAAGFAWIIKAVTPAIDTVKLFIGTLTGKGADVGDLPWMNAVIDAGAKVSNAFAVIKIVVGNFFKSFRSGGAASAVVTTALTQVWAVVKNLIPVLVSLVEGGWSLLASVMQSAVLPAVKSFGHFLSGPVLSAIVSVSGWLGKHTTLLKGVAVVVGSMFLAWKAYTTAMAVARGAVAAYTAVQAILNAVMSANPIGVVILALVGLAAGLIYAYKHSEKFRAVVKLAFEAVSTAASFMWNKVLKPTFKFIVDAFLSVAGTIVHAAASAFGWVPGLGPKLKAAAAKFDEFRDSVNHALSGIKEHTVRVSLEGSSAVIQHLADIKWQIDHIPRSVTIGVNNKLAGQRLGPDGKPRAMGGPVTAGQPYVVGEKRPELFVPNQSGRIIPRVPGGGTTVNINGNVGWSPDEVARRIEVKQRDAAAVYQLSGV